MLLSSFGRSMEGKLQPYAIFSRPLITQPWEAMVSGKPIVLRERKRPYAYILEPKAVNAMDAVLLRLPREGEGPSIMPIFKLMQPTVLPTKVLRGQPPSRHPPVRIGLDLRGRMGKR